MKNVLYICIGALLAVLAFSSCNDGIDIRQDYDFSLSSWYLQKQIATGETVEIRFYLDREGDYEKALSCIEKGLKQDDCEMNQVLLFNQIVFYEKSMDFSSAREKVTAYLEMYPGDKDAVREGYFLETR